MSHVSTVDIEIQDFQALREACKVLGLEFVENQKTYKWYGRWVQDYNAADAAYKNGIDPKDYGKCEHAIRIPGNKNAYEIGVARKADGKLTLVWDFYCGGYGMEAVVGKDAHKLRQEYSLAVAMKDMQKKGFKAVRQVNAVTKKPQMRAWRA